MALAASSDTPDGSGPRRERAAIAAQACQTCRNRKSKCDEEKPTCGLCMRLGVECSYREPLPTKKDKTMVHILETLTRLEDKFDNLTISSSSRNSTSQSASRKPSTPGSSCSKLLLTQVEKEDTNSFPSELQQTYNQLTVPHKIVLWPSIYIHLINSGIPATGDLRFILEQGTPWIIRKEIAKHPEPLDSNPALPSYTMNSNMRDQCLTPNVAFPTLNIQRVQEQCKAYFDTFNITFPLLDREDFMNDTLASLLRNGYADGDLKAVLALLVFALGQTAIDGVFERPISMFDGEASGIRGGTVGQPPGLAIFNEARRRIGFIVNHTTLENVQILLLEAMYYESNARHLEFWRTTTAASLACQVLIKCNSIDWNSAYGDLIKRAYWICALNEDFYHLDLDLPRTGINTLEDEIPLPHFRESSAGSVAKPAESRSHFQYHFLAMIALRRLISRINNAILESTAEIETTDEYVGPPVHVIRELARQLDSWRSLLPRPLQWSDNNRFDFPLADGTYRRPNDPLFSLSQGPIPIRHPCNLDIVTAQLRTRFYYARFVMYRPFVYKALHFPELLAHDDARCAALAIKSACMWPIAMAPTKNKKRLVPHLFAWTQNFVGILLILRMTTENECLRRICELQVSQEEIQNTATLMLDWLRDMKQLDGVADWAWGILEPLYMHQ